MRAGPAAPDGPGCAHDQGCQTGPVSLLTVVRDRLHGDFLMPSRLDEYRRLIDEALAAGYTIAAVDRYWDAIRGASDGVESRWLVLRHDVDTDPGTARALWRIEDERGITSSFFFRLATLDLELMGRIADRGGHVSYHYEELAEVAKQRRPVGRQAAEALLPEARERFARHLEALRARTGLPMTVVASHGDFVNRRLGINNTAILADDAFRAAMGIELETYDPDFLATITSYHRDLPYPTFWMHGDPYDAIARREPRMYALIHPKPWRVNRRVNARDDLVRARQELEWRFARRRGRRRDETG
jgi:hypothetical protein